MSTKSHSSTKTSIHPYYRFCCNILRQLASYYENQKTTIIRIFTVIAISLLTLLTTRSMAQAKGKVTGSVKDLTNKALATTTVSLLQAKDSSLVKAAISDATENLILPFQKAAAIY